MSPEEKKEFEDLKRRVQTLEEVTGFDFVSRLEERQIVKRSDFDSTGITGSENSGNSLLRDTTVGGGGGTVTHLNAPENMIEYRYKNKVYFLPAYNPR